MISIIIAVITLGILVAVHEGGHFVAAKMTGVRVEKFSIGFGPKLVGFFWQETEFVISLIPLGGYVKMLDENPGENRELTAEEKQHSFTHKTWYQRAFIAFSGPFINFIFAIIILIFSFWVGKSYSDQAPVVGRVTAEYEEYFQPGDEIVELNSADVSGWNQILQELEEDKPNRFKIIRQGQQQQVIVDNVGRNVFTSEILPEVQAIIGEASVGLPAYQAGLQAGDLVLAIDDEPVQDWYEMQELISKSEKEVLDFQIQRGQDIFTKQIRLQVNMMDDRKIIGVTQKRNIEIEENYTFLQATKFGTLSAVSFVAVNYAMLGKLLLNPSELKNSVGGPVMLYSMSKQTAKRGLSEILAFIGALNLILMVMNLLPIPILDGGQIMFCFIEGIRKKALAEKTQIILQNIGFVLLMSLMIFAFWNDISKMFERNSSVKEQETEQMIERLLEENKQKE